MDFRFNAHDPQYGAFLFAMPSPSKAQIGDVFGERGTLELTYSTRQVRALDLPTFVAVRMQVQFDGGEWTDAGPELIRLGGSHEDTDQAGMRVVKFVGREWLLNRARVSAGDVSTELIDGKRPFYQASAGEIMRTLLLEAKDRGAASGIDLGGFTASADSAGNAWSERVTIYYSPGLPIGDVLQNLVDQGLCDYRMNGRSLELYEPETTLGRDLTIGTSPVRVHGAVTEAPVQYTLEDLANSALLIGEDGFEVEVDNPSAPDDYGRLEVTIEQGGVNQEGTARTLIDAELQRGSREIREITRTQHAAGATALPYRDYRCGDFVQVHDQGEWQRYRVRELQLTLDTGGWTVHTVLNDRLQELLLRLAKKTNGIVNGSRGSGGDGTRPAPPPKPGVEPAAPEGLVIDQQVYLDDAGTARGVVTAGWGAVTESTRGLGIDIGGYELWWRENATFAVWQRATATSGDTEVSHSPVILTAGDGTPMEYQWRVRAIAQESNRPGLWSNTVTLTMTQDTTPPPPPSAPIVETGFRIVTVGWDGLDENGQEMPRDFAWTRIYLAATENMAGARRVGSLGHPGSWNSDTMPAGVPVWVALTAVDRVGNESPMTPAVSVTPQALVDEDAIQDAIDDAKVGAIEEAVTTAGGRRVHNKTTPPVDAPTDAEFDVWQQWTTLEEGATLLGAWMHDGSTWVKRDITEEYVPRIHIGEGTFGVMSGQRLEVGSVSADKVLIGNTTNLIPDPGALGSIHDSWVGYGSGSVGELGSGAFWRYSETGSGGYRGVRVGNTEGAFGSNQWLASSKFQVKPGESYMMEVVCHQDDLMGGSPRMGLRLGDLDDNFLGETETVVMGSSGFATYRQIVEIPQDLNIKWARLRYTIPSSVTSGYAFFVSPVVRPAVGATIIEDGAITTPKIAALAIEAGHLQANAVEADKIAAGAIDGKMITGATVRTAASGSRVQMNTQGLYAYAPDGEQTLGVSAITGAISLTGNVTQRNSYGRAVFGPELFTGGATPALSFPVTGTTYSGSGGMYARAADSDGKPELHLQGPHASSAQGSFLDLAAGDSTESTILQRNYGSGNASYLSLQNTGDVQLQSRGDLYMRAQGTTGSSNSYFRANANGSIYMQGDGGDSWYSVTTGGAYATSRNLIRLSREGPNHGQATLWLSNAEFSLFTATSTGTYRAEIFRNAGAGENFIIRNNGTASSNLVLRNNSGGSVYLEGGRVNIPTLPTTSDSANIRRISGELHGVTSSARYKVAIEDATYTVPDLVDRLLTVSPKTWFDRTTAERIAAAKTAEVNGWEVQDDLETAGTLHRIPGVIAEDLHDAGLGLLVEYEDGRPEAVRYDRLGSLLLAVVKEQHDRITSLETMIGATE